MNRLNSIHLWALLLLVICLYLPTTTGFAQQQSKPNSNTNRNSAPIRNPDRQSARTQIKAAAAARAQSDPAFKAYLDAVNNHNKQVQAFVRARKGGAR